MFNFEFKDIYELLQNGWHKKSTLIIFLLILFIFLIWFFSIVEIEKYSSFYFSLIIFILFIAFIFWKFTTRLPKVNKGKLGFIVVINYDSKLEKEKITKDFINNLKQLINQINFRANYNFIEYSQFYAQKLTSPDASRYFLFALDHNL